MFNEHFGSLCRNATQLERLDFTVHDNGPMLLTAFAVLEHVVLYCYRAEE